MTQDEIERQAVTRVLQELRRAPDDLASTSLAVRVVAALRDAHLLREPPQTRPRD